MLSTNVRLAFRLILLAGTSIAAIVLLWLFLPCPEGFKGDAANRYINDQLQTGHAVRTVIPYWTDSGPHSIAWVADDLHKRYRDPNAVIVDWRLREDPSDQSIWIHVGEHCSLSLTKSNAPLHVAEERCYQAVAAGRQGDYAMDYFNYADATVLYHQSQNLSLDLWLHITEVRPGVMLLHRYSAEYLANSSIDLSETVHDDGLIARVDASDVLRSRHVSIRDVKVSMPDARIPTSWLPLRQAILFILVPLYIFSTEWIVPPVQIIASIILYLPLFGVLVFMVAVLAWRCSNTRRSLGSWLRSFPHIRRVIGSSSPRIWGVTGELDEDGAEMADWRRRRPRSISGIVDFMRSDRPLDDLLHTWQYTRWMVRPLSSSDRNLSEDEVLPRVKRSGVTISHMEEKHRK